MDKNYFYQLGVRRTEVERTLCHLEDERQSVECNTEWADRAAYESRLDLLNCLADWYRNEITRIDDALTLGNQRCYGLCLACHEPIEAERLQLCPETEFCFDCQHVGEGLSSG